MSRNPRQDLARKRRLRRRNEAWEAREREWWNWLSGQPSPEEAQCIAEFNREDSECWHTWADMEPGVRECVECGLVQQDLDHF